MNRYLPLVLLVVFGQAIIVYLLIDRVIAHRLYGPLPEMLEEVKNDVSVSDEPERIYRNLGDFLINPADTAGTQGLRFMKAQISLGVSPAKVYAQLDAQIPRLRDAVIRILTAKTVAEIDDPEDREFIKDEIRFAINKLLIRGEVLQVYFTDFIIQ